MKLSILIPTLPERAQFLTCLTSELQKQMGDRKDIELVINHGAQTTGEKRNALIQSATGEYVWFVDDDDEILPGAIDAIMQAMEQNPDVLGIDGYMTTDGANRVDFEIRMGHPYKSDIRNGKPIYLRFPNHITPMKRSIASKISFPAANVYEDYEFASKLHASKLLKTQVIVPIPVYHYKFRTKK